MSEFWAERPDVLFESMAVLPSDRMTFAEKMNAITRLIIVIGAILAWRQNKLWPVLVLGGLLFLVLAYYQTSAEHTPATSRRTRADGYTSSSSSSAEVGSPATQAEPSVEGFSVTPTFVGDDFTQTVVPPTFAEEWQIPPPAYDLYTPNPASNAGFAQPLRPQSYPYGQYLTKTNLLPIDEEAVAMSGCGGARSAREYINGADMRNRLAHQENMQRLYKMSIARRFKHNTNDTFSPFESF